MNFKKQMKIKMKDLSIPFEIANRLTKREDIIKEMRRREIENYPICRYCGKEDSFSHECNPKDINIKPESQLEIPLKKNRGDKLIRLDRGFIIVQESFEL